MDYKSDIVLGNKYRDKQTGMEGTAVSIEFHQHRCEQAVLEVFTAGEIKGWLLDTVRLEPVEQTVAAYVQPTNGGPTRSRSFARPR